VLLPGEESAGPGLLDTVLVSVEVSSNIAKSMWSVFVIWMARGDTALEDSGFNDGVWCHFCKANTKTLANFRAPTLISLVMMYWSKLGRVISHGCEINS
jgi:hypothetical protein